ncbi:hypothetical protein [Algibacter sp. L3A6]|uniref:hypothetical protein n=1 Tax=Algibacter sp. L3A6 TaxID=2686366 RepID=UPI00131BBD5A|nr:hypothetical protein [Algibacter sp. L3A6]
MKKVLFILMLAFFNFSFTNGKIEPNSNNLEKMTINKPITKQIVKGDLIATITVYPCEGAGGVTHVTTIVDCEGDGVIDYEYSGYTCADYAEAILDQFVASC